MPTALSTLASQIAAIDAHIIEAAGATQMQDGNTSASFSAIDNLIESRNRLQALYDRLSGAKPLFVRGRIVGLPNGPSTQVNSG